MCNAPILNSNTTPSFSISFAFTYSYNSASEIRRGTCQEFVEPACDPNIHEDCDDRSSFNLSSEGKIRTVAYPTLDELELDTPEVNHTYCARADVYQVVDSTGRQLSIAHASKELHIKFTGIVGGDEEEEEYLVESEASTKDNDLPMAVILVASLVGALVVLSIVVIGVLKRYNGGLQIHDSTIKDAEDTKEKDVEDGEIELL